MGYYPDKSQIPHGFEECDLIPIMRLNIDEDGYCDYHKFKSE